MILLFLFLLFTSCEVSAQERHITTAKMLGVGYNSMQDSYLSPERYGGLELRYMSHTVREKDSCLWSRLIINEGYVSNGKSRSKNGSTIGGAYHFQYGALRRIDIPALSRLSLNIGAQGEVLGGVFYNTRNGNNPAQMRAAIDIGPVLRADYALGASHNWRLSYEISCPLLGLTFSPNFGQSYYEIFSLGNYDHNVVPTTIISTPSFRNQLTLTIPIARSSWDVIVGYVGDYRQQCVNKLKQHSYSSILMVGLSRTICAGRRAR